MMHHDFVGLFGVISLLMAYLLLQLGFLSATQSYVFAGMNLLGSLMIMYSLLFDYNLSAFAIELCWSIVSTVGIVRIMYLRHKNKSFL